MKKRHFLAQAILTSLLSLACNDVVQAQDAACNTCQELNTLNAYTEDTSTNTATISAVLQKLLQNVTIALFGTFYDFGNTMAAFTAIPAIQNNGYIDQQTLLHTIEQTYQGNKDDNGTLTNNYRTIFGDYLLQENGSATSFNENDTSIASLYLNPSAATFYSDDQRLAAQHYIILASGAAMSQVRKPASDWLTIRSNHTNKDKEKIRENVSAYYTYSAMQSAIIDNFTYIYGLNTGQAIEGTLDGYPNSKISEAGLFTYIQSQKAENEDWYNQLKNMGIVSLLREQTILLGGSFLMLARIEEDLRRILITTSTQTSLALIGNQAITQLMNQMPKTPTQP